ncbi:MAG: tRNA uridine-5-carboxymethylaminomethyl(34) synthesis GTPase MnmE [Lachnospiraceae bacterium]|nr:tRNA uridine-5-carboxymethylaminomethyl(34) synthesis GTPase MnmE [Lachnospiraceae bacterium]
MRRSSDTIAAISTAVNEAGIAIIRISGPEAIAIADRLFSAKKKDLRLSHVPSHTIHYGWILENGLVLDEVLVSVMRAPRTYTTEDVVEINCHGGIMAVQKVLKAVLNGGARIADPGEFTKRAFLNGRLDLSEAEAVMELIRAENEYALRNSIHQLQGMLGEKITAVRKDILHACARIEAALDDPEHYSLDGYTAELSGNISAWKEELATLSASYQNGRLIREGIKTVIIGKPNAGKSSLLNALAKEELAIVTAVPGTTRDLIHENINLGGITLKVIDTAGIRDTEDVVEKIGVRRAEESAKEADLLLCVLDSTMEWDAGNERLVSYLKNKKAIILLNKTDLDQVLDRDAIRSRFGDVPVLPISALYGDGLEELEEVIRNMFFAGELSFDGQVMITSLRQRESLERAQESLCLVEDGILMEMPEDLLTIDLMNSAEALGEITGESLREDLVDEIFSQFCMGK